MFKQLAWAGLLGLLQAQEQHFRTLQLRCKWAKAMFKKLVWAGLLDLLQVQE